VAWPQPRGSGVGRPFGVCRGTPTMGVAKSRLLGEHGQPMQRRGAWVPLRDQGETIGAVLRSRAYAQPIFVSIGHRISLPLAVHTVLACTTKFRLPETTRWAHRLASGGNPAGIGDEGTGMGDN